MAEIWAWPWRRLLPLSAAALFMAASLKVLDTLWWRPKRMEEHFRRQGIGGPPYRFFLGNVREMVGFMLEASSKPMAPQSPHNILPRVLPFFHHWKKIYGIPPLPSPSIFFLMLTFCSTFLLWFGTTPRLVVADPDLIRQVFVTGADFFDRYESHPLVRQLEGEGLVSLSGEKWAQHRKILAPSFHVDNLRLLIPAMGKTVVEMMGRWAAMAEAAGSGEVEIDVSEWFQGVAEETITRAEFGRSYDDGKVVFGLQAEQMVFAGEALRMVLLPGYRYPHHHC